MAQNDYYALMGSLQAPEQQKKQRQDQLFKQLAGLGMQFLAQRDIKKRIAESDKTGEKVQYTIDENTGAIKPVFSKNSYESVFEAIKNPDVAAKYELGRGSKGEPRLIKKKTLKPNVIEGLRSALSEDKSVFSIKNPATGETEDIDSSKEEDVDKVMKYLGIEDWRNNPELIEAGIPQSYDEKISKLKEKNKPPEVKVPAKVDWNKMITESLGAGIPPLGIAQKIMEMAGKGKGTSATSVSASKSGSFQAGDIREKDGVKYIRDASGSWHPVGE